MKLVSKFKVQLVFKEEVGEADSGRITDNDSCDFRDDVVSTGDARDDEMGDD